MLRSTGVAEEAACMVYLAISKLQTGWWRWHGGQRRREGGLRLEIMEKETGETKEKGGERKEKT